MRTRHLIVTVVTVAAASLITAHAQTPKPNESIVGAWTLNKSASDLGGGADGNGDGREGGEDGRRGDGSGGRRRGGGGFCGGGGGAGGAGVRDHPPHDQAAVSRTPRAPRP